MKRKKATNVRLDQFQEQEIEDLIRAGRQAREIASMYKVKIGEIYKIKNKMPTVTNEIVQEDESGIVEENAIHQAEKNVISINDVITNAIIDPIETEEPQPEEEPKKRKRISEETKKDILNDIGKGLKSEDIMKKYDISTSTLCRLRAKYKEMATQSTLDVAVSFDPKNLIKIQNESYIKLGLVADRHNINPVKDYIFETFDNELMFDYEKQFEIAKREILKHVQFNNGKAVKGLMLYATGLQAALVTVIRVCDELGIQLVVMHYNADDQSYYPQNFSIMNDVIAKVPLILDTYVKKVRLLQLYNCLPEDLNTASNILEVKECYYDAPVGSINRSVIATDAIIFVNKSAAWDYFRIKAEEATPSKSVFINTGAIERGKYISGKSMARITN